MDGFGQRTMTIDDRWTKVDGKTVHFMDGFERQTVVICYKVRI